MHNPLSNPTAARPGITAGMAVDAHLHVFAANVGVAGARYVPAYDAPFAQWQALAHAAGVHRGVLVQTSFLGTDNSLLLQTLARRPDGLRGVAVIAPNAAAADLAAMHRAGVRGMRLNLAGGGAALDGWRQAGAVWDALLALGWHVELHTDSGALPAVLAHMPASLPVVLDHMGKPEAASAHDASVRAVRRRRGAPVWVKLSGPYRLGGCDARALAQIWRSEVGVQRLLWGSDWPFTNHEHEASYGGLRRQLDEWLPDADERQAALCDNPQRLYWGEGGNEGAAERMKEGVPAG